MDDDQRSHLEGLRQAHLRRLRILEQQAAITGVNTRPEVLTEIEDLQASIARIDAQLAAAAEAERATAAIPVPQPPAEPRRTQATILSAALAGASALFATLDPEDAVEVIGDLWRRLDAVVT